MSVNIAVLLDLNAFPPGADKEAQHKHLKWVHEHILTLVSTTASAEDTSEVDYSKILWSHKYFNSSKDVDYRSKELEPFSISTFEGFENSSLTEYDRYRSSTDVQESAEFNRCSCLSQALMRLTSDLRWEENVSKKSKPSNIVYTVLRVPRDEDELMRFTDSNDDYLSSPNSRLLLNALLPSAFLKAFHGKHNIQLNFIDTWVLDKEENLAKDWNGTTYAKQIGKVLEFLNKGTVIPLQKAQHAPPGLPSYFNLLKNSLRAATASTGPRVSEKLSEAQKVLQHNKLSDSGRSKSKLLGQDRDLLNLSLDSLRSNKSKRKKERGTLGYKENRGRASHEHDKRMYMSLHESFGGVSADSSASEDYGSQVFGKNQETALNKFISQVHMGKKSHHHPQARTLKPKCPAHHSSSKRSMQPPTHKRPRRHSPPKSSVDGDSILSGPRGYSRTAQLLGLATDKERKKWAAALRKEEEERRVLLEERGKTLNHFESLRRVMNVRLTMHLENGAIQESTDLDVILPSVQEFKRLSLADTSTDVLALCQTLVPFVVARLQKNNVVGQPAREVVENALYIPITELRATVLKSKNDEEDLEDIFRECQFQILIRLDVEWLLPQEINTSDNLRDEIVDLLSLLAVYKKKSVDDFLNNVVVQAYMETLSELLIRIYRGLNMDVPRNLMMQVTPSKSIRSRCSFQGSSIKSPFGSTESLFVPPPVVSTKPFVKAKDALIKREDSFVSNKSQVRYASHVYVNNPKKMMLVPRGNVNKLSTVPKSPRSGRSCRVRRNLFDADGSQNNSALSLTRLSRSPSVGLSNKSYGGSLASPRVRPMKSKRKLNLGDDEEDVPKNSNLASPDMFSRSNEDSNILCPATPSEKSVKCRKRKRSSSCKSSSEKVIQESPECPKAGGGAKSFMKGVHALSFYSTGSDSFRSRAWEKSGNKMMAAKIKRKIDSTSFMNSGLTLSDLEIIGGGSVSSPESKSVVERCQSPPQVPKVMKSPDQQEPCCSKTVSNNNTHVEVVPSNVNANIEALIRGTPSLALLKTTPKAVIGTPTKKISFNFDESRIKTPIRNSPGTPKSILKTPNRGDGSCKKIYDATGTPSKATHFQVESQQLPIIPETTKPAKEISSFSLSSLEAPPSEKSSQASSQDSSCINHYPMNPPAPAIPVAEYTNSNDPPLGIVSLAGMANNVIPEVSELQNCAPQSLEPSFLNLLNYGYSYETQYIPTFYQPQFQTVSFSEQYNMPPPIYNAQFFHSDINEIPGNETVGTDGSNLPPDSAKL